MTRSAFQARGAQIIAVETARAAHPRELASADVRLADLNSYPHDEPCPRCGRRQWLDEHEQETCQACGYFAACWVCARAGRPVSAADYVGDSNEGHPLWTCPACGITFTDADDDGGPHPLFAVAYATADDCDTCWYFSSDQVDPADPASIAKLRRHLDSGHLLTSEECDAPS